jgi:hypothetical protein
MSDPYPASVHLRRILPLIAVVGLLAPGAATAGNPAPDQPPESAALAPDPAPVEHGVRAPLAVTPLIVEAPRRPVIVQSPVVPRTPVPPKRHKPAPAHHVVKRAAPIVDVVPTLVDLHPELGALPTLPRDESKLVLAAAALLAAAAAAGTGTMLTLTARKRT